VRPRHMHYVGASLSRIKKKLEREALLRAYGPAGAERRDFRLAPRANALQLRPFDAL